jgi:hypothetical protein
VASSCSSDTSAATEHQGDAEQHQALYASATQTRHSLQQQHRQTGENECRHRHLAARRQPVDGQRIGNGQRGTQRRRRGHAKGEGTGQRVVEDRLHLGASQRQRGADQYRHQRVWQAHVPDDHPLSGAQRIGVENAGQQLAQAHARGAAGQVGEHAGQQQREQQAHQCAAAQQQAPVAQRCRLQRGRAGTLQIGTHGVASIQ